MQGDSTTMFGEDMDGLLRQRYGRRLALKSLVIGGGATAAAVAVGAGTAHAAGPYASGEPTFDAITPNGVDAITLATGFTHDVVISWGDPITSTAPAFDIQAQTKAAQEVQCGFNHDYADFRPLPNWNSTSSDNGLLFINHEYTDSSMMFETYTSTASQIDVEMAAHGATIVEVNRSNIGVVSYNPASSFNRRITAFTPMTISGPVAGDPRIQTTSDPAGTSVLGMLNNCGGGNTPWGTVLTAEENFDQYFGKSGSTTIATSTVADPYAKKSIYESYTPNSFGFPTGASIRKWETSYSRFDLSTVDGAKESLKFGWIVEIDPYDPQSTPKKRTALGRFKHEAAAGQLAPSGKFVSYSGDDQVNQYVYKFVTAGTFNPSNRAANMDLLDTGTLYVAKFNADGTGTWMPLTFGTGPLVAPEFDNQADVLMRTRRAAALLGATKMARPEDVEVNPITKKVYVLMTGNNAGEVNAANPRASAATGTAGQGFGHVVEITEAGGAQDALTFTWEIFLLCGEPSVSGAVTTASSPAAALSPSVPGSITWWAGFDETKVSPIARVDNVSFDNAGMMYLSTDGMPGILQTGLQGRNDSLYAVPTEGAERGHAKALLCAVDGCEVTGPYFTPDDKTLFVNIQHPGVDVFTWNSATSVAGTTGTFANPGSSWNTTPAIPGKTPGVPRPATIAIRRNSFTDITFGTVDENIVPQMPSGAVVAVTAAGVAVAGLVHFRNRTARGEGIAEVS
jgi:uncharacterized protein